MHFLYHTHTDTPHAYTHDSVHLPELWAREEASVLHAYAKEIRGGGGCWGERKRKREKKGKESLIYNSRDGLVIFF